jgi:glyoxylate reductase
MARFIDSDTEEVEMEKVTVVFLSSLSPGLVAEVVGCAPAGFEVKPYPEGTPMDVLLPAFQNADFVLTYSTPFPDELIKAAKKAKLISVLSAGYDRINVKLARECGIPVANNGGANSIAVSEQAILHMLAVYRHFVQADRSMRAGRWRKGVITRENTYELAGKLVGIVGMGNIGKQVALRLHAFECRLQYHDMYPLTETEEGMFRVKRCASLEDLLRTSDVVTVHLPLTAETNKLMNRERLALMKPTAIFVNTGRGPIVDQPALYEALRDGKIAGAGLDVLEKEPVDPADPILTLDNVSLSPHVGGHPRETYLRRARNCFDNMQALLAGRPLRWVVN